MSIAPPFVTGTAYPLSCSYGTILYFLSFFFNGRQRGKPIAEVAGWVGGSNGLWIIFPLVGMYASFQMISTQTFDVVRASVVSQ